MMLNRCEQCFEKTIGMVETSEKKYDSSSLSSNSESDVYFLRSICNHSKVTLCRCGDEKMR